jgi:DNA-binding transcriptional ArsR family regulator
VVLSELTFAADDLALTRFAISPMMEVVTSFRLVTADVTHPVHRGWLDQVRPRVAAARLGSGFLSELVPQTGYLADFLTPPPGEQAPTIETELAAIRATPADDVRADVDKLGATGPRGHALRANPDVQLGRVVEEIETYWQVVLAPYWARIRVALEADVFHRARQVAEFGAAHLFNDLHATLSWDDNTLRMIRRHCGLVRESTGRGLLLIPSAFTGCVLTWSRRPHPPELVYPARGVGTLWEHRPVPRGDAIAAVLGRSRAMLLTELEGPASTTELARRTGISAAAVSQHLTTLRDAGMVSAHRAGRSVLYARTAVAESLLTDAR